MDVAISKHRAAAPPRKILDISHLWSLACLSDVLYLFEVSVFAATLPSAPDNWSFLPLICPLSLPAFSLCIRTSVRRLWAALCCDVTNWTGTRSKTCSCAFCISSRACQRVGQPCWVTVLDCETSLYEHPFHSNLFLLFSYHFITSEALFAYWNKAAPSELMDFFTLIEWVQK